jgi:phage-related protein
MTYFAMTLAKRKPLHFVAGSLEGLQGMPADVQDVFASALLDAEYGDRPAGAGPFGEGLPSSIMKLVEDFDGDTFRIGFTVSFPKAVYVLHGFNKKSSSGRATPKPDRKVLRT